MCWSLRLCIGLYRPSDPAGGLKMVVKAVHTFNFCSGDKIQSKSALWCKIWSCFGLCGTLYRPLRLCIGLYRPSEAADGLKMVVKAVHKFNFCSGDKIQSKSALWCKKWSCFGLCGTLEAAICYWRPPTASP